PSSSLYTSPANMFHYLGTSSGALGANGINTPTLKFIIACASFACDHSILVQTNSICDPVALAVVVPTMNDVPSVRSVEYGAPGGAAPHHTRQFRYYTLKCQGDLKI